METEKEKVKTEGDPKKTGDKIDAKNDVTSY